MPMRLGRWSARAKKKFIIQEASDFGFPPRWAGERAMVWCWSSVVDVFLRTRALEVNESKNSSDLSFETHDQPLKYNY